MTNKNQLPHSYETEGISESLVCALANLHESQMELSHMADSKANIMITVSSILLTLAIAKIESGELVIPGVVFIVFCITALFFAILCVMPSKYSRNPVTEEEINSPDFNPLYFGNFTRMSADRFQQEMELVLTDARNLYESYSLDIYSAGMVLQKKKFRYLRWSYIALMLGIVLGCMTMLADFTNLL